MMFSNAEGIKRRINWRGLFSIPIQARHVVRSAVASLDDDPAKPSERLLDVALSAAAHARSISMSSVVSRMTQPPYYPDVWPGEHYKLLAGLILAICPRTVIEIGTSTGLSALAMVTTMPPDSRLITFDLIPWKNFEDTCLRDEDFNNSRITQIIGDVCDPKTMKNHEKLFHAADIIFVDGPKDGRFEYAFLNRLEELQLTTSPLVVLDDIRLLNMLSLWRQIQKPKLDLTSFGHWTGTGLVEWTRK
jgi:predicted O-methyltransferase YrrM